MDVDQTADTKYPEYQKIKRLNRDCSITEKIDGTNALIQIVANEIDPTYMHIRAGQRTKWIPGPTDLTTMASHSGSKRTRRNCGSLGLASIVESGMGPVFSVGMG